MGMRFLFENQTFVQITAGVIVWVILFYLYLRFTKGVGKSIISLVSVLYVAMLFIYPLVSIILAVLVVGFMITNLGFNRSSKPTYQRAQAKFEGGGIRRGLTPPEVAVILGRSYPRIIVLILVRLLEKGFLKLSTFTPFGFQVAKQMRTREASMSAKKRAELRRQGAQELKQVLFPFEELFLELIEQEEGKRFNEIDFGVSVKPLIRLVSDRVGGYDLSKSREYYQKMILKRMSGGASELKSDKNLKWSMSWKILGLDNDQSMDNEDNGCYPDWLIEFINSEGEKITKETLNDWVKNLEGLIKSGLSQDVFEFNLSGEFNSVSSEIVRDIAQTTYHA